MNTIVNEAGIWPLELTCRFGYPGFAILGALQSESWATLFQRMLRRDGRRFATAPGYAVGVVLTVPPFPYRYGYAEISRGLPITIDPTLTPAERARLQFGEVAQDAHGQLIASGIAGYLLVATGTGLSVEAARDSAYRLAERVYVPNVRYRMDIGSAFLSHGRALLTQLGLLPSDS